MIRAGTATTYADIAFRSRIEAEFAAFLDLAGIRYTYEPGYVGVEGIQYKPDFVLPEPLLRLHAEVKPSIRAMAGDWIAELRKPRAFGSWPASILVWFADDRLGLLLDVTSTQRGRPEWVAWARCIVCNTPYLRGQDFEPTGHQAILEEAAVWLALVDESATWMPRPKGVYTGRYTYGSSCSPRCEAGRDGNRWLHRTLARAKAAVSDWKPQ